VATELEEKSMFNWLSTLPIHSYDVRTNPINDYSTPLEKPLVQAHFNAKQPSKVEPESSEPESNPETDATCEKRDSPVNEDEHHLQSGGELKKIKLDS